MMAKRSIWTTKTCNIFFWIEKHPFWSLSSAPALWVIYSPICEHVPQQSLKWSENLWFVDIRLVERTLRIVLGGEIWVELHKIVTKDKPSGNRLHLTLRICVPGWNTQEYKRLFCHQCYGWYISQYVRIIIAIFGLLHSPAVLSH